MSEQNQDAGKKHQPPKRRGNREQMNQERKQRKLELAQRDDTGIVSRLASETNDAIYLLTQNDFIVSRVRGSFGRPGKLSAQEALAFLERNEGLRQEMNLLNIEMAKKLGINYRPPRGYERSAAVTENIPTVIPEKKKEKEAVVSTLL